jgi:hypothetical protein
MKTTCKPFFNKNTGKDNKIKINQSQMPSHIYAKGQLVLNCFCMKKMLFVIISGFFTILLSAQSDNFIQVIYIAGDDGLQHDLNIFNNSTKPGGELSIAPEFSEKYFSFIKQSDGYYYIINNEVGLYLEPQSSPAFSGCKIVQNAPSGNDNQKWKILPGKWINEFQTFYIMPKLNDDLYITIKGASVVLSAFSLNQEVETQRFIFYDCFPETVFVLAERGYIPINTISKGDWVASWNYISGAMEFSQVDSVLLHAGNEYSLTRISFVNQNLLYASTNDYFNIEIIDATENHPILTSEGYKPIGEIGEGDIILYYSDYSQKLEECIVVRVQKNYNTVNEVFNIKLNNGMPYIVNHTVASPKCPYVSIINGSEIIEVSEVLRNQLSYYLDKNEHIVIPTNNISGNILSIRIDERKDEISFIDNVYLIADGILIQPLISDAIKEIFSTDNQYLEMTKGDFLDLSFELPQLVSDYNEIQLVVKGYYILLD